MVDDRSSSAKAMSIVSQITTIGLLAIMPMVIGSWLDGWLGWKPILTLVGVVLGLTAAGFQLMRLVRSLEAEKKTKQ